MRGKAELNVTPNSLLGDHPRLCGEKKTPVMRNVAVQGSPPPMRGKAAFVAFNIVTMRITPAYAGKRRISYGKQ